MASIAATRGKRFAGALCYAFFLLAVAGIGLALGEYYLRAWVFDPNRPYIRLPGWQITVLPHPEGTPGLTKAATTRINGLGLSGEMPGWFASPRWVTVGGSTTEEIRQEFAESWPGRLQAQLRYCFPSAWLGNAGKAGTSVRQHYMHIELLTRQIAGIDTVVLHVGGVDMLFDFQMHRPAVMPENWDLRHGFMYLPPATPRPLEGTRTFSPDPAVAARAARAASAPHLRCRNTRSRLQDPLPGGSR